MIKNTTESYGSVAKFFHWFMAIIIIGMLIMGFFLEDLKEPSLYKAHKSTGFLILLLALIRLTWRFLSTSLVYKQNLPKLIKLAAHLGHYSLYILMILVPSSAFLASNAAQKPIAFLYVFDMPLLFSEKNLELAKFMMNIHSILAIIFTIVIAAHFLAALYHHYIRKDDILKRMLPNFLKPN